MKKISILAATAILFCTAFRLTGDEILAKLGVGKSNAEYSILTNLTNEERFTLPYTKLLPSVISGDKTGAARELCIYIKEYCSSAEFEKRYQQKRDAEKPASEPEPMSEDVKKAYKASIAEMEKTMKDPAVARYLDQKTKTAMQQQIDDTKKLIAAANDPTPNKTKWEKQYPADVKQLLRNNLQNYLSLVATVDFKASLQPRGRKMIFVNPEYEKKSLQWKACYRAGKEVNDVVTQFAKDWLKTL